MNQNPTNSFNRPRRLSGTRSDRPNVVLVLTDDQGYGDLSCHGNPVLKTPNLDKLHEQSIRFTDFHVAPVCTPTRSQLLTGRDALDNGARFVCMGSSLMRPDIPTMADIFKDSGYRTGHFGKWHVGDNYPYRPQDRGFQETVHHPAWGITSAADYFGNDYFDDYFRHNSVIKQYNGYCTDVWFDEAMKWIKGCHEKNEPFFAYIPTNAPHSPHWVPDKYRTPYRNQKYDVASFFGMIANIDENMGRLEQFLEQTGLRDNTILVFMGDNGGTAGVEVYNAGMRGRKAQIYDGGHRVPFFIRWSAGELRMPGDIDELTQCQDLLPTLIDLCGLSALQNAEFDGVSLAGLLRNETQRLKNRMLVVQYGAHPQSGKFRDNPQKWGSAVLWQKWRLVGGEELYDVGTDPGQQHNVAQQHPEVVDQMRQHYEKWWSEVSPNLDNYYPITIGSDQENPTQLSSVDWAGVYCDNQGNIRGCVMDSGPWHIVVARGGTYDISLRRWPAESGLAITAEAPPFQGVDGTMPKGKALPVAKAWLKIGNFEQAKPVGKHDKEVTFTAALKSGRTTLQTWFYDANGKELCGAYYAHVHRR